MKKVFNIISVVVLLQGCAYNVLEEPVDCSISDIAVQADEIKNADCDLANGLITVSGSGGESPYLYSLDSNEPQSLNTFTELSAGIYMITITDANGCTNSVEVVVENNEGVTANASTTSSGCGKSAGTISVSVTNGDEPYSYILDSGQAQPGFTFIGLGQGSYEVRVVDANGCDFTFETQVLSGVSFVQLISPIIANNCALASCHGGTQFPDFRVFSNIQNNAQIIKTRTQNKSMPLTGSLTNEQIDLIACWVDDGALDN
ncbi:MAG: hypothetical protein IH947_15370 [Bacteroidetes bacterium]|nr:hypothetical protein [Bacteroidota bacterium]